MNKSALAMNIPPFHPYNILLLWRTHSNGEARYSYSNANFHEYN